ncbi:MAG TPA: undecaprenyldiphospho-muramoylpentapeptide beta-N-acetylglucosaminyltransferase [Terriglobia bacterium]|nr:undecaprenyldiphospho-muramoylpentapeptide beta-N-acetylglucosaminyltransferase [Terriglobia bacterium]
MRGWQLQAVEMAIEKTTLASEQPSTPVHGLTRESTGSARVLMAAGGTGGHIFPALAVAEELRARWLSRVRQEPAQAPGVIQFLGTGRGLEARLIPSAGFPLRTVDAAGLVGIGGWKKARNLAVLPRTLLQTVRVLRDFKADVVLGMGGYLAGPAMLEAALADIPTILIEPNAVPGFTNRLLAPLVRVAALGFEETARFYGSKARVTGHPVRKAFYEIPARDRRAPFTILILGGSQGSTVINRCVVGSLPQFAAQPVGFVHQTGERDYNTVRQAYKEAGVPAEIYPFIEDVPKAFGRSDLIVSRSGASAVAELAAAGKASILVPFAAAAEHHQVENARVLERAGATRLLLQSELTPDRLAREVRELLESPERLAEMERAARQLARPDAAARVADLVEELARK